MHKQRIDVHIEKNALVDNGDGVISFPGGQCIVDDSEMWNGLKYDINSLDISQYKDTLTCDHIDSLQTLIGKVDGTSKQDNKVTINSIRFAVQESAAGKLAYDLMRGGFLNSFSVETAGPWPGEEDRTYRNHALVGLSTVVTGNNKSASINELVKNSIAQSKQQGLDTTKLEQALNLEEEPEENGQKPEEPEQPEGKPKDKQQINQEPDMKFVTIKNKRDFAVRVAYKNATGEDAEQELAPGSSIDVSEDQQTAVETQLNSAQKPQPDVNEVVKNALEEARKADSERFSKMEEDLKTYKEAFDKGAQEPEFRKPGEHEIRHTNGSSSKLADLPWRERVAMLARNTIASQKGNRKAGEIALAINGLHLEQLQQAGLVDNSVDLGDLGNFVIPREMITEIKGHVSNYQPLLNAFNFQETLSLDTAYLVRTGDVQMVDVDMADTSQGVKPIGTPSYTTETATLTEFAAVTPIKSAAIKLAAVDMVQEITKLYRRAYDRALGTSIVGRLEQAVQGNGNTIIYDYSSSAGGSIGALLALIDAWSDVAEFTPNGIYLMTEKSRIHLLSMALKAGPNGPLATIFSKSSDGIAQFLDKPYVIVPSTLMPSLNTASTVALSFEGVSTTVHSGVLYADPENFMGRVSGGLDFQMSAEAAYEDSGTVKSAFQRDELLFRGYGYRKSAITLPSDVSAILAPGVS